MVKGSAQNRGVSRSQEFPPKFRAEASSALTSLQVEEPAVCVFSPIERTGVKWRGFHFGWHL